MPDRTPCRLLIDSPASGAWNMAVDEVLLESAAESGGCWWRFYRWREPTLSLGYFQLLEDRARHAASRHCGVVRRASGGGAIVHDAELTYSLAVTAGHPLAKGPAQLYRTIHATLVDVLAGFGIEASLWAGTGVRSEDQPFLCFQRRAAGDVVCGDAKIGGSAQRRLRGAVLQHGSVLLERSGAAPELAGLADLGATIGHEPLIASWTAALSDRLRLEFRGTSLSEAQQARAAALARTKYGSPAWTAHRGR
ncbi:MAG: lipoate--protein ligase [Planctomycetia bacterium]|nr:lipoate--protein ligase [Planctomycetia bacterium]